MRSLTARASGAFSLIRRSSDPDSDKLSWTFSQRVIEVRSLAADASGGFDQEQFVLRLEGQLELNVSQRSMIGNVLVQFVLLISQ